QCRPDVHAVRPRHSRRQQQPADFRDCGRPASPGRRHQGSIRYRSRIEVRIAREDDMDCCGHGHAPAHRQWMWSPALSSDGPMLGRDAAGVLAALLTPEPGQLYKHHLERLAWADELVAHHGLVRALTAADLAAAHKAGQPAIVGDVEGLDFLEMKIERLEE